MHTAHLRVPLLMMAVVGMLSFNFQVVLPAVARFTYHGTATTYALMMNFLAAGALAGALLVGTRNVVYPPDGLLGGRRLRRRARSGRDRGQPENRAAGDGRRRRRDVAFSASVQSAVQLAAAPEMRGRVLSLYQIVYQGTTPLGRC